MDRITAHIQNRFAFRLKSMRTLSSPSKAPIKLTGLFHFETETFSHFKKECTAFCSVKGSQDRSSCTDICLPGVYPLAFFLYFFNFLNRLFMSSRALFSGCRLSVSRLP